MSVKYIVSTVQKFAVREDNRDLIAQLVGYEDAAEMEQDDPETRDQTVLELAQEHLDPCAVPCDEPGWCIDEFGQVYEHWEIEDYVEGMITDFYGEVQVGLLTWDAGRVLREMDEVAFRCEVADYTSQEMYESWEEWHDAHN